MTDVQSFLSKDTETAKEKEFKEGMTRYLDLIDQRRPDRKPSPDEDKKPQINFNSISKLKNSLLEGTNDPGKDKRAAGPRVNKLETKKIESVLQQSEVSKPAGLKENVIAPDQTLMVKKMFVDRG